MTATPLRPQKARRPLLLPALLLLGLLAWTLPAGAAVEATDGGILFTHTAPDAGAVFLAGDFNGWNATAQPLIKGDGGVWSATLALETGEHEYKFVVDGNWVEDAGNPNSKSDPFGGNNSLVVVTADGGVAAAPGGAPAAKPAAPAKAGAPTDFKVGAPKAVDGGVQFTYHDPGASRITLAGSFNGWNADELPLTSDGKGNWVIVHALAAGKHEYKFVVDGAWMADPENPDTQADPYGGANSLVTVGDDGRLVAAAVAAADARPRSNNTLNARVYVGGRYLTRFEFAKNVPVSVGDENKVDPRYRLQRPSQTVDLNFDTQVSDLTETTMRLRLDSDQNIIQNNVAGFLDEARLHIHPDNFDLKAYWNQEIYSGGDLMNLGGSIDLPGTIWNDQLDFGKGSAGGLFTADPAGVHLVAFFANLHNQDYYNDPDLFDNVGEDRAGLRLSKRYGKFEVGLPLYTERSLVWLDFGTLAALPSTGIPILDDHRARSGDSSTWYEVESHDYKAGIDLRYELNERWGLGMEVLHVDQVQRFVTGNESGQNNTNGSLELPFLDRTRLLLMGQVEWTPRDGLDLRLQQFHADMDGADDGERALELIYQPQDVANKNIFFNLIEAPAAATMDSTDLTVSWTDENRVAELWVRRMARDLDYGVVGQAAPGDPDLAEVAQEHLYLAGRYIRGETADRFGRTEFELGYTDSDWGVAGRKDTSLEMILRWDRDISRNTGLIGDLRWVKYDLEGDGFSDDADYFNPFVGLRYSPIRQLRLVAAYGVDPVDLSIDYDGRQIGRWLYRQQYLFDHPDASLQDAEEHLSKARVVTLRAQLQF